MERNDEKAPEETPEANITEKKQERRKGKGRTKDIPREEKEKKEKEKETKKKKKKVKTAGPKEEKERKKARKKEPEDETSRNRNKESQEAFKENLDEESEAQGEGFRSKSRDEQKQGESRGLQREQAEESPQYERKGSQNSFETVPDDFMKRDPGEGSYSEPKLFLESESKSNTNPPTQEKRDFPEDYAEIYPAAHSGGDSVIDTRSELGQESSEKEFFGKGKKKIVRLERKTSREEEEDMGMFMAQRERRDKGGEEWEIPRWLGRSRSEEQFMTLRTPEFSAPRRSSTTNQGKSQSWGVFRQVLPCPKKINKIK